ncbi:S4 domain-containing protein [Erythrobacter sp. LQ02-29]|uniref:S4 domain-containing protein n=1 Tax=Erythrobacter sp. LQ02-29 TaxID=2920384 RepID=UPI001F4D5210|nr:S4 domain-containing protein [Erythrobacter sp. LQ02-29]
MRIDLALCRLRLAKTRSIARRMAEEGHLRLNGERVVRATREIVVGDVLVMPRGKAVAVLEILTLPDRRGPAAHAQSCYRMLDPAGEKAIAPAAYHPSERDVPE